MGRAASTWASVSQMADPTELPFFTQHSLAPVNFYGPTKSRALIQSEAYPVACKRWPLLVIVIRSAEGKGPNVSITPSVHRIASRRGRHDLVDQRIFRDHLSLSTFRHQ